MAKGKEASQGKVRLEDKGKGKEAKALLEAKGPKANRGKEAAPKTKAFESVKP